MHVSNRHNRCNDKSPRKQVVNSASTVLNSFGMHFKALREFGTLETLDGVLFRHLPYLVPYQRQVFTTSQPQHDTIDVLRGEKTVPLATSSQNCAILLLPLALPNVD